MVDLTQPLIIKGIHGHEDKTRGTIIGTTFNEQKIKFHVVKRNLIKNVDGIIGIDILENSANINLKNHLLSLNKNNTLIEIPLKYSRSCTNECKEINLNTEVQSKNKNEINYQIENKNDTQILMQQQNENNFKCNSKGECKNDTICRNIDEK